MATVVRLKPRARRPSQIEAAWDRRLSRDRHNRVSIREECYRRFLRGQSARQIHDDLVTLYRDMEAPTERTILNWLRAAEDASMEPAGATEASDAQGG